MKRRLVLGQRNAEHAKVAQGIRSLNSGWSYGAGIAPVDADRITRESFDKEVSVATVTTAVAQDVANVEGFRFEALDSQGEPIDADPYAYAMNIAASPAMNAQMLRLLISYMLDFAGEIYLLETPVPGTDDVNLTPLIGGRISVKRAKDRETYPNGAPKLVAGYELLSDSGKVLKYWPEPGPLIRIHNPHPMDPLKAVPVVKTAGLLVDTLHAQRLATRVLLKNHGMMPGVLSVGTKDELIPDEDLETLEQRINSKASDSQAKGRIMVIDAASNYTEIGSSPISEEWAAALKLGREEMMSTWAMPPGRLGMGGARTFENQRVELGTYYRNTPLARLQIVAGAFVQRQRLRGKLVDYRIDTSGTPELQEDATEQARRGVLLFRGGVASLEESREMAGLPPTPEDGHTFKGAASPSLPEPEAEDEGQDEDTTDPPPQPGADQRTAPGNTRDATDDDADQLEAAALRAEDQLGPHVQRFLERAFSQVRGAAQRQGGDDDAPNSGLDATAMFDRSRFDHELADDLPGWLVDVADELRDAVAATTGASPSQVEASLRDAQRASYEMLIGAEGPAGIVATMADEVTEVLATTETVGGFIEDLAVVWGVDPETRAWVDQPRDERGRFVKASTIATTEVHGIGNAAVLSSARKAATGELKVWRSRGDDRVRPAHLAADGQEVAIDSKFEVMGEKLDHPRDPAGSAGNTINCRCWVTIRRAKGK